MKPRLLLLYGENLSRDRLVYKLAMHGYECFCCETGADSLSTLGSNRYDLLLADTERIESGWDSFLLETERCCPDVAVILLASERNLEVAVASLKNGAYDYIMKPLVDDEVCFSVGRALEKRQLLIQNREYKQTLEEQVANRTRQLREALDVLHHTYRSTLLALGTALDNREIDNEGHSLRVTMYALRLARQLGLSERDLEILEQGALLHDIGKLGVPDSVLRKGTDLEPADWDLMMKHPEIGFRILSGVNYLSDAAQLVLQHHERYDGKGYPVGLKREAIQLHARVFAVADVLDSLVTDHCYRPAVSLNAARETIRRLAGTQLDPAVVEAFLSVPPEEWQRVRLEAQSRVRGGFVRHNPTGLDL